MKVGLVDLFGVEVIEGFGFVIDVVVLCCDCVVVFWEVCMKVVGCVLWVVECVGIVVCWM